VIPDMPGGRSSSSADRAGAGKRSERGFRFGLDRLADSLRAKDRLPELRGEVDHAVRRGRVGLITNHSAVDAGLQCAADVLQAAGCRLAALFGPEHGIRGDAPDGQPVPTVVDRRTGLPCFSLYGEQRQPSPAMLAGLDALVYDIQDVGARFYTFESTMSLAMEAASEAGLPFVVLDRPNPLGGDRVEGPLLEPQLSSFVGLHPIPVRHGCTIGELARLFHQRFSVGAPPYVVPMEGWERRDLWHDLCLPWVPPSPNMPTADTALVYPGLALLEGTNISEGRGTAHPFEFFGAPWLDAGEVAGCLNAAGLPGVRFRPHCFQPAASKHAGELCAGAQAHVLDPGEFRPVLTGLGVLHAVKDLSGERFEWLQWQGGVYSVDRLAGTDSVRESLNRGESWMPLAASWESGCRRFLDERRPVELYA
jgi:uncharacterized protein YbbC (DUF1343 family)